MSKYMPAGLDGIAAMFQHKARGVSRRGQVSYGFKGMASSMWQEAKNEHYHIPGPLGVPAWHWGV